MYEEFDNNVIFVVNMGCDISWDEDESEERGVPAGYEAPNVRETTQAASSTPGAQPTGVSGEEDKDNGAVGSVAGSVMGIAAGFVVAGAVGLGF